MDPEEFLKKPIFWRDRMLVVVQAKRDAEQQIRDGMDKMRRQLEGT